MHDSVTELSFQLNSAPPRKATKLPPTVRRHAIGRIPRVTQVMALAIRFQRMIQDGAARDYADLARLGCLTRERMSQIMELIWLAPDIQQEILEFPPTEKRFPISEVAVRLIAATLDWNQQRDLWRKLKLQALLD
jgi:hypothetical protein